MARRANPEAAIQTAVKEYLGWCLPRSIEWTASLAGTNLSLRAATRAKSMGVRKGWPDLQFLFPDGVTRFIELKAPGGSLSPEQREFRDRCTRIRPDIWAVCRSVEEVAQTLANWGAPLKAHPFSAFEIIQCPQAGDRGSNHLTIERRGPVAA